MKKHILFIFIFIFGAFIKLNAQDYYFKHYQVEDGLSYNSVICSLQDSRGFMWFGTKDGLNRFDGYNFKIYRNDPGNKNSLNSNFIECLHQFHDYLWVGTDSGLYKYNEREESFKLIKGTLHKPIVDITSTGDELWFIAGNTLYRYSIKTQNLEQMGGKKLFSPKSITTSPNGVIWVAIYNAIFKYNKANNSFQKFNLNTKAQGDLPFIINCLKSRGNRQILIGTQNNGALIFDIKSGKTKNIFKGKNKTEYVRNFEAHGTHELWISSEHGLFIYNFLTKKCINLQKSYSNPYSLSDNAVIALTEDSEGGMWVGTYFGGINYYPKQYTPFSKYFPQIDKNSISGNAVREIKKDIYGNLWVGTEDGGLNKFNPVTGQFKNFKHSYKTGAIAYNNIHGLLPLKNKLWIGTFEHGLDLMDIKSEKVIKHFGAGQTGSLRSNFIYGLNQTKKGEILALTALGMQQYDPKKDIFIDYPPFLETYFFTAFLEHSNGKYWAGTYREGLISYDPKTKHKNYFQNDLNNQNSLSSNSINGIFEDSKNQLWITTENGLNRYNPTTKNFKRYTTKQGFPSNVFYSILEDAKHNLWITTSNGLVRFNPKNENIRIFKKANGILNDQFNYHSAYKDANGKMYFGSVNGMISFNPDQFKKNTFKPPFLITGLQLNNKEVSVSNRNSPLQKSIIFTKNLTLKNNQSTFSLDFASLSFTAPNMTEYWYKLEGLNDQWVYLGKKHRVNFTELPAGDYNFKVKSLNRSGLWNDEASTLHINILPPFYASMWAYLVYILIIALLLFFGFRFYHRRILVQNEQKIKQLNNQKEREIYQAKIKFFTNIAHEIRTPLTLIKSPLDNLITRVQRFPEFASNLSIMEKNTNRLLNLVNQLLDFRKIEIENVRLTFLKANISEMIRETELRFSQLIQSKKINFKLYLGSQDLFAYIDKEAFKKILSNIFNNALKYGKHTVIVTLTQEDDYFILSVKNDGNLIPVASREKIFEPFYRNPEQENIQGTGIGLSLAFSLAELHSGSLRYQVTETNYNNFVLELPKHQKVEFDFPKAKNNSEKNPKNVDFSTEGNIEHPHILLVEDDEDLRSFVAKELSKEYYVFKAKNVEEALKVIATESIQLILSDIMMEGKNGYELCEQLKNNLETSHIPVILLTAKNNLNSQIEGLESGADAYITKPFATEHLKVQVTNLLANRRHIMEYYASSPLSHLGSIAMSKTDETFIDQLDTVIYENMSSNKLSVEFLAEKMGMSRSTLYRKIKELSDLSPNELINISRLKKAAELLRSGEYKIYEISEMVGYNSQTSFGRNFQKQFNRTPTEYMQELKKS